jgi:TrpR family trp operon transcriptional repressor
MANTDQKNNFINLLVSLSNKAQATEFLDSVFTPSEVGEFSTRLEIVKRLKNNQTQRQVANDLNVGIATVSRGAREVKNGKFKFVDSL